MRAFSLSLCTAMVAGLLSISQPAFAVPTCPTSGALCIDESVEGQTPTITAPPGVTFTITPLTVSFGEAWTINLFWSASTFASLSFTGPAGLLEPGTLLPSDILLIGALSVNLDTQIATLPLTLFSDNDLGPIGSSCAFAACTLIEDGTFQQMPIQFSSNLLSATSIYLKSDVEVPEPASLALLGTALVGFGLIRRRRRLRRRIS